MILTLLLAAQVATCTPIDGDTLRCGSERVRLLGIDAPELRARCPHERRLAIQARDRLEELLAGGYRLVRSGRDVDRYGRRLRVVVDLRGRSIGDVLVAEGLARTWSGRREPWC